MADLSPLTTAEMIAELEREIALRRSVYPRFVAKKRLRQDVADRRIKILEAIISRLREDGPK